MRRITVTGFLCALAASAVAFAAGPALRAADPVASVALPAPIVQDPPEPSGIVPGAAGRVWVAIDDDPLFGVALVGANRVIRVVRTKTAVHGLARMRDGSLWVTTDGSTAVTRI